MLASVCHRVCDCVRESLGEKIAFSLYLDPSLPRIHSSPQTMLAIFSEDDLGGKERKKTAAAVIDECFEKADKDKDGKPPSQTLWNMHFFPFCIDFFISFRL